MQTIGRMEFHISRKARDTYKFDLSLYSSSGNVIFANFHAVRLFAQKMNQKRDLRNFPETAVRASQLHAMGLIDEILHFVMHSYRQQKAPLCMADALQWLESTIGQAAIQQVLERFTDSFPPIRVYRREQTTSEFLAGSTDGIPNQQIVLEELIMLWLSNENPAFNPYAELFDDMALRKETAYLNLLTELKTFFETQPKFGPDNQNLIDMLRAPALASPYSLTGQLDFIRQRWMPILGRFLYRILTSLDFIKEEEAVRFGGTGPIQPPVMSTHLMDGESENFSPDRDWMPNVVLLAKNTYVWLDQLSRQYQRPIHRLDQIPDEELDRLSLAGFTGLWLIGLWERSQASQRIKQLCGNPDAVASAYSLQRYDIAADLGGETAYENLRDRAWQRGIRLASDMVPNHMGIDSDWVMQHPDWFLSLDYPPYPSYSFNGPDLSPNPSVGIFIEDHYYDRTDAAVVFKRTDRHTGEQKYIYHGNDGTSMPWNDTAQLNYLNPQVREAVIQTILHVARRFPIIRFDAAMTLAKKHYQRLWFPEPGTGGAIPTRSEYGLTKDAFDSAMPVEFWREVVDRAAIEAPNTLLLAEAFWLMEGYFVRTLGMHRVYNSAFMNMLRNEDNAGYRNVMKNILEFDPEILKRFVNFMNNPDERTAVDQFGKGDKYFGICTLMATLPGLPMFGHGQIEGYSEKYGMEFRKPLWDEQIDTDLVRRHEWEIFPILHKRYLYANVENFLLYDLYTPEGYINEDVFAYSNRVGAERTLVIVHNKYASTRGTIRNSVAFMARYGNEKRITQRTLGEGLNLHPEENYFVIFRDARTRLQYIRNSRQLCENGFFIELEAYQYHTFIDFEEVVDDEWHQYAHLHSYLAGKGVPSIEQARQELFLQPIHYPFRQLFAPDLLNRLINCLSQGCSSSERIAIEDQTTQNMRQLLHEARLFTRGAGDEAAILKAWQQTFTSIFSLSALAAQSSISGHKRSSTALKYVLRPFTAQPHRWIQLFAWLCIYPLGKVLSDQDHASLSRALIDEWLLNHLLENTFRTAAIPENQIQSAIQILKLLVSNPGWNIENASPRTILEAWFSDAEITQFLGVNRHQGILWFNKEAYEELCWWMNLLEVIKPSSKFGVSHTSIVEKLLQNYTITTKLLQAEKASAFQVEKLIQSTQPKRSPKRQTS